MPFTPFHLIAGAPLLINRRLFASFAVTDVLIDCEVAVRMAVNDPELHSIFHTLPMVFYVALFVSIFSRGPVWRISVVLMPI